MHPVSCTFAVLAIVVPLAHVQGQDVDFFTIEPYYSELPTAPRQGDRQANGQVVIVPYARQVAGYLDSDYVTIEPFIRAYPTAPRQGDGRGFRQFDEIDAQGELPIG